MKLWILLLLAGCSMTPQEREQRELRTLEAYEQWSACKGVYNQSGVAWVTRWRTSPSIERGIKKPRYHDMRDDMAINNCHFILKRLGF